jgi:hypothetical protein
LQTTFLTIAEQRNCGSPGVPALLSLSRSREAPRQYERALTLFDSLGDHVGGKLYIVVAVSGGNYSGEYIAFALAD